MTVFVFGSNLAGVHGAGAALYAMLHCGAKRGRGHGMVGKSYAIPTKDQMIKTLPLPRVEVYIKEFLDFASQHPELNFKVTQVGCGLAGFTAEEIAPLFRPATKNCLFDTKWKGLLGDKKQYWGTF